MGMDVFLPRLFVCICRVKAFLKPSFSRSWSNLFFAPFVAFLIGYIPVSAFASASYWSISINGAEFHYGSTSYSVAESWAAKRLAGYKSNPKFRNVNGSPVVEEDENGTSASITLTISFESLGADEEWHPGTSELSTNAYAKGCPASGTTKTFQGYAPSESACLDSSGEFGHQGCGYTVGIAVTSGPVVCANGPGTCFFENKYSCTFEGVATGESSDAGPWDWSDGDAKPEPEPDPKPEPEPETGSGGDGSGGDGDSASGNGDGGDGSGDSGDSGDGDSSGTGSGDSGTGTGGGTTGNGDGSGDSGNGDSGDSGDSGDGDSGDNGGPPMPPVPPTPPTPPGGDGDGDGESPGDGESDGDGTGAGDKGDGTGGGGDCDKDKEACGWGLDETDGGISGYWGRIQEVPILKAATNIGGNMPSGSCSVVSVNTGMFGVLSFDMHCAVFSQISGMLSTLMIGIWSIMAVRIVLSA